MLEIMLLGINHKTAPVALRECVAFTDDETRTTLKNLSDTQAINELIIISTCNRLEFLFATDNPDLALDIIKKHIAVLKQPPETEFENSLYIHKTDEAVRHIFRVASSLDSMMVGEPQILGQIKQAYHIATNNNSSGVILNRLLHRTFFVAKRVRTETGIGDSAVSISYAAIELGRKIFGILEDKKVLLIGAGEMAELAVEHLIRNRVSNIFVANRTFERGAQLAKKYKGLAIRFEEISSYLKTSDIVISSTGSPGYVVNRKQVKSLMRKRRNRPLFFIDIAVPRDIDPAINHLANTYVYDIDDLSGVIDENLKDRAKKAVKGERIIDEAVIRFHKWHESLKVVPTIIALRKKMDEIAEAELKKTLHSLGHLSKDDARAIQRMTKALLSKIMHDPTRYLKSEGCFGDKSLYLDITRKLFNLDS